MKDEKILQEEMLSDEELDKVSGGSTKEEVVEHFREWLKNFGPAISDLTNMHKDNKTSTN